MKYIDRLIYLGKSLTLEGGKIEWGSCHCVPNDSVFSSCNKCKHIEDP